MYRFGLAGFVIATGMVLSATSMAADHKVTQAGKKFSPGTLNIKAGDTVTFVNNDKYKHNVYSRTEGLKFRIKKQKPGQSNTIKLDKDGKIAVRCALHPNMKLTINVSK